MSTKQIWLWSVLLPVLSFFGQSLCVLPVPRFLGVVAEIPLWLAVFTVYFVLVAVPASIYFAVIAVIRRKKDGELIRGLSKSLACLCFVALWFVSMVSGESLRHRAFVRASHVGDRIVEALSQHKRRTGEYPEDLNALLPTYLDEIPYTGMIGYPEFTYLKDHNDLEIKRGEYELRINCPSGGINFDRFIYWPSEKYPNRIQGKPVERIRGWAYVHE